MTGSVRAPHPALAAYVGPYVGYHHVLDPRSVHHGLPAPSATVVLSFDEPLDVGWLDGTGASGRFWTLASGLHTGPALIRTHGLQHGIQLTLTPVGVRTLLGVPLAAIGRVLTTHDDLPLGIDPAAYDAIASADSWEARFDVLEAHLLRVLAGHRQRPAFAMRPEATRAWDLLERSHGLLPVAQVAARVGWSGRHLAARFTAEYGVGPKQAARLMRFEHARALAEAGHPLADVAARCGYADQAHLTRDWRSLAGRTPAEARGEPFRIVQDGDGIRVPVSTA